MKFLVKSLLVFLILIGSNLRAQEKYTINFEVDGFPDSIAYIGYYFGNQKYILDTLDVIHDAFSLSIMKEELKPGLYFIYTPNYFMDFVLEARSFRLKTSREGGYREMEVTGSPENNLFKMFQVELGSLQKEQGQLQEQLKGEALKDSVQTVTRLKEISREMDEFKSNMTKEHPESFTTAFLKVMESVNVPSMDSIADPGKRQQAQYQYYKDHYFDLLDLSDPRLLRTPLLHEKVMKYFDELLMQQADTINKELDWFFTEIGEEEELFRYWLVTFFKHYAESKLMGMDAVTVHLIENYYLTDRADWVTADYEKKLREEVAYVKPNLLGSKAPPLNVMDTLMQPFYLDEVDAPFTLLFIYDPDCGHCKETIKELEEHDSELSELHVQLVAVCTVTDVERWKEFVRESNPSWAHAIDPTGKSYFRVTYNVRSTPKMYLLGRDKKIIAKQLNVEQIVDFVRRVSN